MQRFCLVLELRRDPALIAEYERLHQHVWPEIQESIRAAGVYNMEIYRNDNRLVMLMDTDDAFTMEHKALLDAANPKVVEWEMLMAKFQQVEEGAEVTRKWRSIPCIFRLAAATEPAPGEQLAVGPDLR